MSKVRADQYTNKEGTGAPSFPNGVSVTGVLTATSFSGSVAGTASNATLAVNAQGLTGTPNITVGTVSGTTGTFSGNVSIGGTLTYDDVTNVDSVGLITARNGINVTAGVSTFAAATHQNAGTKVSGPYSSNVSAMGANAVDCSAGNYFTKTITGATTFTFTNVPSGVSYTFTMEVTLNGSNAITWPASVKWPLDTAPTISDAKTQLFTFITDDGGTTWRGALSQQDSS